MCDWRILNWKHQILEVESEPHWHYTLPKAKSESVISLGLVFGDSLLQDCLVVEDISKSTSEFLELQM
jgi:hypothetical protein